jgi:hypothetical protein
MLTIKSDGSIRIIPWNGSHEEYQVPGLITRTGIIYTLTADVEDYQVVIECSNIIFDGAGHKINAPGRAAAGLQVLNVNNVNVRNLEVTGNSYTSIFAAGSNCIFTNVTTSRNFYVNGQGFNTVTESNLQGLYLFSGSSLISKCNVSWLYVAITSGLNVFAENNFFLNDSPEMSAVDSANTWDNGSLGNYWSDYLMKYPNASEIGNTGIGDTPNVLDGQNVDRYPIMYPLGVAPAVSVFSSKNATYFGSFPLNFSLSKPAAWIGYSLDGQENVTVAGNVTLTGLSLGLHNVTVYAKDAFGYMGASETLTFAIAEKPFPVVPVVTASVTAIAAVVSAGLLFYFRKRHANSGDKT